MVRYGLIGFAAAILVAPVWFQMMPRHAEAAEAAAFVAAAVFTAAVRGPPTLAAVPDVSTAEAETDMPGDRIQATRLPVALAGPVIP